LEKKANATSFGGLEKKAETTSFRQGFVLDFGLVWSWALFGHGPSTVPRPSEIKMEMGWYYFLGPG